MILAWSVSISILLTRTNTKSQSVEFSNIEKLNETSIVAQASTEIPDNETDDDTPAPEQNKKSDEITWAELGKEIKTFLVAVVSLLVGLLASVPIWIKQKLDQYTKLGLNPLDFIPWLNPCEKVNSILVVGMGGVGKTSLVYKLTGHPDANSDNQTKDYEIYQVFFEQEKCNFYISDYAGKKL